MNTLTLTPALRADGFDTPSIPPRPSAGELSRTHQRPVAVVIGSGFGGLAAAIRLSVKGYEVKVFEKLDAPGGRAYVHHQDGFTFDAGPTIITAPFLLEELWALCGKSFADDVKLVAMDPFYRVRFSDGTWFWLVWLAQQGAVAITTGWVMLATLLGLAIVEHVIMIFPWPLERLWGWAMGQTTKPALTTPP